MAKYTNYSSITNNKLNILLENYDNYNKTPLFTNIDDFYKWLVGFTDGEDNFKYYIRNNNRVTFMFVIELHIN